MLRHGNTGKEMVEGGAWARVGRHHYRHASGVEITKDASGWVDSSQPQWRWSALWVARHEVERRHAFPA
jgi:hypothetical protein